MNKDIIWLKLKNFFYFFVNFFYIFFNFLIIYAVVIKISNIINPTKTVDRLFFNFFCVASQSMEPGIQKGDTVIFKRIKDKSKLIPGDIIYFETQELLMGDKENMRIIHRVMKNDTEKKEIKTQGDNNDGSIFFEEKIKYDMVIAEHIYTIRENYINIFCYVFFVIFGFWSLYMIYNFYQTSLKK